ncbi:DUF1905 domain-containing protein [Caulobacter sp. NIBR2454]|uniref:DUF1905 domain-containing protein n=1 Tax=Caulobacter sp. NIBR2454 TaxID=3015996 RepID=UPI0022B75425|nr:DUF1905 domain-containing protein [Caulobacter sp. NIBR2454]
MRYEFETELWIWPGEKATWHFVSLPQELTAGIKTLRGPNSRGWGSMRVRASIGEVVWSTSIFPGGKSGAFLLPVKASVRRAAGIAAGDRVAVVVELEM